jgi:hypothetical protein
MAGASAWAAGALVRTVIFVEVKDPAKEILLSGGGGTSMAKQMPMARALEEGRVEGSLKFLCTSQIQMIDEALSAVGDFGEVRLVVQKGRLRFVVTHMSHDALEWEPGSLDKGKG